MDCVPRLVDPLVDQLSAELPVLFLPGPRASGKTTTASRRPATIVRLDREAEAVPVRADLDAAPPGEAARHLATLRDRYSDVFVAGLVLHTGARVYRPGDWLLAAPISVRWG